MKVTSNKKRVIIQVYGMVQGVFFRASTCDFAQKIGLRGTVRNVRDGSVEIVAEGEEEDLNKLITFAKTGPPSAKVYNINVSWEDSKDDLPYFRVTY
ncbi:MAG: acylphosphatase [Candidatus Heimdallarchaeota archaeon]|nr:acylphosphatase [Candidatus Heimdallarchaeota archaeon]MCK4769773.1 acylphosphatase [Candidatus Heimdallarchaeota archaeon]